MNEANYICFLAKNISLGLYRDNDYYVLPEFNSHKKAVYFPDLNYSSKFWSLISKSKAKNLGDSFPKEAIREIDLKIDAKESKVVTHQSMTFNLLETEYGTSGSYYKKVMTQRLGNTKEDFERLFLQMKLKLKNKDKAELGTIEWHKRNAIVEYLLGKSNYKSSIELKKQSDKYLKRLGFDSRNKDFIKNLNNLTTKQEKSVINLLDSYRGKVVTFDQVARVLWKNKVDDKFSLEAIAKVIENLRNKIKKIGINKEVIFTKRGSGYLLDI